MDLGGRNVLVTGASRGIGEAVARRFVAGGAHVVGVARNAELLSKVMADVGGTAVAADLADPAQVDGLVARIEKDSGPIDILVNNAGLDMAGALVDTKPEDIRTIHQVNLVTPIELCRQVLPGMLRRGRGHIVNVSSLAGVAGFSGMTSYCSTKGGLTNFTGVLRLELKGTPVGTTLVELGPIPTDMLEHVNDFAPTRKSFDRFYKLQLLVDVPREQVADEIAGAVQRGKRHVRIPKRALTFPLLNEAPRRIVETLLVGVRSRP
ncbi:MAG TPA: SDR family oxidoreductase [Acidimicrobiales bacterium]|nr:SDR family oxidoreductase [Acidimicrobiales bacterium]